MKKLLVAFLIAGVMAYGAISNAASASDILPYDQKYYQDNIEMFHPQDWFAYWSANGLTADGQKQLQTLKYYVRVSNVDLSKITDTENPDNPDNVNRVIRLMPKDKFEAMFPLSTKTDAKVYGFYPGKTFSYHNFLKAVAVMPGYCGDYSTYPVEYKTPEMDNPDAIAKKFLATTFAHAVQETSDGWVEGGTTYLDKIPRTFADVKESHGNTTEVYPDTEGPFAPGGAYNSLTTGNLYYGRGAKQLSYPANYSNVSLLLYGDLRLVKYPELVAGENCLPFLTAICYALIPKSGNPSLAEVMDGTLHKNLIDANAPSIFLKTYDRGFVTTVLLVNGGPECDGNTANINNTKIRIDSYNAFATGSVVPLKIPYKPTALLPEKPVIIIDHISPGYSSCLDMYKGKLNDIWGTNAWQKAFARPYYFKYKPNWDGDKAVFIPYIGDTGIQIFGGEQVKLLFK